MDFNDNLLTVEEVSDVLRINRAYVYKLIKDRAIVGIRMNKGSKQSRIRIRQSELERFLKAWETTKEVIVGNTVEKNNGN